MTAPLNPDLIRVTLRDLLHANEEVLRAEATGTANRIDRLTNAEKAYQRRRGELQKQWDEEKSSLVATFETSRGQHIAEFDDEAAQIDREFATATADIAQICERDEAVSTKEFQESSWTLEAIYDAEKKKAREHLEATKRGFADQRLAVVNLRADVAGLLEEWGRIPKAVPSIGPVDPGSTPGARVNERLGIAREQLRRLRTLIAPRLLVGDRMLYVGLVACLLTATATLLVTKFVIRLDDLGTMLLATLAGGLALGAGGTWLAKLLIAGHAQRRVQALCEPLHRALTEAESICKQGEDAEEKRSQETVAAERLKFKKAVHEVERLHRANLAEALTRRDQTGRKALAHRDSRRHDLKSRRERALADIDETHRGQMKALEDRFSKEVRQAEEAFAEKKAEIERHYADDFARLESEWRSAWSNSRDRLAAITAQNEQYFPDWHAPAWRDWQPSSVVPPSLRFGSFTVPLPGAPKDERLPKPPAAVVLPALLNFPQRASTLIHAVGAGRGPAAQALFALALRYLTSLPAGKVRLTIIDPVSLGENFAALMHLGDHDPQLVGARIWTEPAQIEKRLADMSAHMENVIQKYLRSQYASIEEYNAQAGEVAEPYRVLVVANFPAGFTAEAARRLERIATGGANCGIYTAVAYDPAQPMPQDYDLSDLQRASTNLRWEGQRLVWDDADFRPYPLAFDGPPTGETLFKTLDKIGVRAKDANRVEVDFAFIAPAPEKRWTSDSRAGIDVPLGRAGATKRQFLHLGKGTAQHALVAGKTGSGKSTLLHALITNLALHYRPDEVELYLIDFKKGVEFKTYAQHRLPHARVVAIESEREFGLSVLQRLDAELKRRGDLFRQANVQDIRGYRDSGGGALPRIMLIVDEFQEFFVEDDRVAQEAALLLDRLVRQGRAFGLHVLLGSQTLGGAYSLARSTIDQMAVRIALQCSEADAGLILSKDNNAARLLSRPGEAIYNDANGLVEGNDIFQVCWLAEDRREEYLNDIARDAAERGFKPPAPPVVFEGNIPSDLTTAPRLRERLAAPADKAPRELVCWLGDAMAIKEPTAAIFKRQSANNLLMFGQQPDIVRGLFVSVAVSALAQSPRMAAGDAIPRIILLDGTPADDPALGEFERGLGQLPGVRVAGARDVADIMRELSGELERRQAEPGAPPVVLMVYGLHRFRDLRKAEDDFGFNRTAGEPSPAQRFSSLLRDGPTAGVHAVVWCDTLVNFQRAAERATLREFEMKVLFQMSANDSSTLIDSPAASRLGVNRALFAHEELSAPEKFRPYSLPDAGWYQSLPLRG